MNATKNTTITQINDVRNTNDFKTISFSEYKKTEVKKQIVFEKPK